jgi:hypothetical protein
MSKVLIEISGGLGNQLFQLSAATYLHNLSFNVKLDCSPNQLNRARKNEISELIRHVDLEEYRSVFVGMNLAKLRYKFSSKFPCLKSLQIEQKNFSVPIPNSEKSFGRYRGYWQNSINADTLKIQVRNFLKPVESLEVGMHVRKGDYLDPKHISLHGELPIEYFIESLRVVSEMTNSRNLAIYSDSPLLLNELISTLKALGWNVRVEESIDPWETLRLMSGHKFLVASNSTYSWWAGFAGLSDLCFFPSYWFTDSPFPSELNFDRARLIETNLSKVLNK